MTRKNRRTKRKTLRKIGKTLGKNKITFGKNGGMFRHGIKNIGSLTKTLVK